MPKAPKNYNFLALKRARNLFKQNKESDTEESSDSDTSEEYSHIPLKSNIPLVDTLKLDDPETDQAKMDQINNQLTAIMQQLAALNETQHQQQQAIQNLQNIPPAPAVAQVAQQNRNGVNLEHLSKIPDPIKAIPTFDGNRKQLSAWLTTAENTLNLFRNHVDDTLFGVYVTAVTNKIQGKAKDILCLAGNPQNFDDVKEILINALGDRQELSTYKCQLWQTQMNDGMSIQKYYQKTKDLIQNIKTLAKQKESYKNNWQAINEFIEEDGLAAFIAGLREPYFGYAQAARPTDLEDAYAFLCKFKSKEMTAACMTEKSKKQNYQNSKQFRNSNQPPTGTEKKSEYKPNESQKQSPTPMEIDPSIRSRLTLNKKHLNNTELDSDSDNDSDQEATVNFQQNQETENQT